LEAITNLADILTHIRPPALTQIAGGPGHRRFPNCMPQTLHYRPVLIDSLISNERINSYQCVFHPANDVELMGVYLWNAHVCGAL